MTDQKILDYTVGRATNDVLEKTVAVWFKDEGDDGRGRIGPIYLQVSGDAPTSDDPYPHDLSMIPFAKGGEAEWHTEACAFALAKELGVEVVWS